MKIIKLILGAIFVVAIVACYFYSCVDLCDEDFKDPRINKIQRIEAMEYSDTTRFCNANCKEYFSARLKDSVKVIDFNLRCANCGSSWGRHKTSLEWTIETQPYND